MGRRLRRLTRPGLEWLWHELAHAIREERPLPTVLQELAQANRGTARGAVAGRLAESLATGRTLAQAIADEAGLFPPGTPTAVEAGERAGRLPEVLESLSESARQDSALRSGIISAMAYPAVIAVAALSLTIMINRTVVPMWMKMFEELDVELPAITMAIPSFLRISAFGLFFAPALLLTLFFLVPSKCLPFRGLVDAFRLSCPIVSRPIRRALLARWCKTIGLLVAAHVPEPAAVRLAGESSGNKRVEAISRNVADRLAGGVLLGEAMTHQPFFHSPLAWMVRTAEQRGGHTRVWPVAAELYRDQADLGVRIVAVVLSTSFGLLALQVAFWTALSLFLPLIKLMGSIGG